MTLRSLKLSAHSNWLCIGDFNQVLNDEDKFSFHKGIVAGADSFKQLIFYLNLCEVIASGQKFTWMNKRDGEDFVMERLDRAFASVDWVNAYPGYSLRNLPIVRSDHGPILLDFEITQAFRQRPFRFERMWMTHSKCKEVVQVAWNFSVVGFRAYRLKTKLSNLRKEFIRWNKQVFGRVENDIRVRQAQLQGIQNSIHTVEDVTKEKLTREELETLMHREEVIWS